MAADAEAAASLPEPLDSRSVAGIKRESSTAFLDLTGLFFCQLGKLESVDSSDLTTYVCKNQTRDDPVDMQSSADFQRSSQDCGEAAFIDLERHGWDRRTLTDMN